MILLKSDELFSRFESRLNELASCGSYVCLDTNMFTAPILSADLLDSACDLGIEGSLESFKVYDQLMKQRLNAPCGGEVELIESLGEESQRYLSSLSDFLEGSAAIMPLQVVNELGVRVRDWGVLENRRALSGLDPGFASDKRNRFYGYNEQNPIHRAVVEAKTNYLSNLSKIITSPSKVKVAEGEFGLDSDTNVVCQARAYARARGGNLMVVTGDGSLQNRIRSNSFNGDVQVCNEYAVINRDGELFLRDIDPKCIRFAPLLQAQAA